MAHFSKDDLEKMSAAVKEAEKLTNGEIVPVIAERSDDYTSVRQWLAIMGFALSSLFIFLTRYRYPFLFEVETVLVLQGCGIFLGLTIGHFSFVQRFFIPKSKMKKAVHERALVEFMQLGLQETKHRTGVLLYISLLERRVEILADKGIHQKVGDGFWSDEVNRLVAGIRSKNAGEAFSHTILTIGQKLRENFPRDSNDKNELGDSVRMR